MSKLETKLNARSAEFQANASAMRALVEDLHAQFAKVEAGGGEAARSKHTARGKLLPRERVAQLLDPGTPTTDACSTEGCVNRNSSISRG